MNYIASGQQERIKEISMENLPEGKGRIYTSDDFWKALNATGTEIWLDTGNIEAAGEIWTREMTALTTNNTLLYRTQIRYYSSLIQFKILSE